jgi:hypothetical protein
LKFSIILNRWIVDRKSLHKTIKCMGSIIEKMNKFYDSI